MKWGGAAAGLSAALGWNMLFVGDIAAQPVVANVPAPVIVEPAPAAGLPVIAPVDLPPVVPAPTATLAAGTPIFVMLDADLSTMTAMLGDRFPVIALHDVVAQDTVVIPKGATGYGEVTFTTNKGAFGKPGIIGITLRHLQIGGRQVALSGRYREEGANNNGATAATFFAVGVFAGFIKGKPGVIPRGRELKARTGEPIIFTPGVAAVLPTPPVAELVTGAAPDPALPATARPAVAPEIASEKPEHISATGGKE